MRMRTNKKQFTVMSNETIQKEDLSFEALGLLIYCLSMPEDWEFFPKKIAKSKSCGRDKCYRLFDELIKNFHCIRIIKIKKNLQQGCEYEIFDDPDECKKRIEELKKCLRDPDSQDSEIKYTTKDTYKTKETIRNGRGRDTVKNGRSSITRECGSVDKSVKQPVKSQKNPSANKNRSFTQVSPTVSEQSDTEIFEKFDPFKYRLKNGNLLNIQTARAFAKYKGKDRIRLVRNILWYEKEIESGKTPNTTHEKMLQWAIKNDLASKASQLFQNEFYVKLLKAEGKIAGLQILKTVVRISSSARHEAASISLDLPHRSFKETLDKYVKK